MKKMLLTLTLVSMLATLFVAAPATYTTGDEGGVSTFDFFPHEIPETH